MQTFVYNVRAVEALVLSVAFTVKLWYWQGRQELSSENFTGFSG